MKIPFRTFQQWSQDKLQESRDWKPCFLFWPRRARDVRNRVLQHLVIGRCARRRDFIATYLKSNDHDIVEMVKEKLEGNDPVEELAEQLDIYASDLGKYRVVFWFDN